MHGTLSDASTVIYLAKADALAETHSFVGDLLVPPVVWEEMVDMVEGRGQLDQEKIRSARDAGWLQLLEFGPAVASRAIEIRERRRIGRGESEVIAAARKGSVVLMDDRRAARVARSMGLNPMRTISLPLLGLRHGLIASSDALELLWRLAKIIGERADVVMRLEADMRERAK